MIVSIILESSTALNARKSEVSIGECRSIVLEDNVLQEDVLCCPLTMQLCFYTVRNLSHDLNNIESMSSTKDSGFGGTPTLHIHIQQKQKFSFFSFFFFE